MLLARRCPILAVFCFTATLLAQPSDAPLKHGDATRVARRAASRINEGYVFPDVGQAMEKDILARIARNEYDGIVSAQALCNKLTQDLQSVSHDNHIRVVFNLPPPSGGQRQGMGGPRANLGVQKVEKLAGNIGYLDFRAFLPVDAAGEAVTNAMNALADTDALIIDVRQNGGGAPAMVAFLASYLFDSKPVQLNTMYSRGAPKPSELWTRAEVPGRRYGPDKPVYVLIGRGSFSAAEGFTYHLQALRRITVVGEQSGGGANPGGVVAIDDHFGVFVPGSRVVNPITKTNWEGVGVRPDIESSPEKALQVAHLAALRRLMDATSDPARKKRFQDAVAELAGLR